MSNYEKFDQHLIRRRYVGGAGALLEVTDAE